MVELLWRAGAPADGTVRDLRMGILLERAGRDGVAARHGRVAAASIVAIIAPAAIARDPVLPGVSPTVH